MNRLTDTAWRNMDPWETCGQDNYCKRGCHEQGGCKKGCAVPNVYAKLAKYEDTGLTPEEIKAKVELRENCFNQMKSNYEKLLKMWDSTCDGYATLWEELQAYKNAEEQGLLIRTPCKAGDIVYANKKCLLSRYMFMETKPYVKCEVVNIKKTKTRTEINLRPLTERAHNSRYHRFFGISSIGKTVFLTREEAESVLKGGSLC